MNLMKGKKILVVDDDAMILELMETILTDEEAEVVSAPGGQQGLRLFYTHRPDLVILDILMPELDGWEMCNHIRLVSDVPIIMLTGLGDGGNEVRGLDSGADDFVVKPFTPDVLLARVRAALRRSSNDGDANNLASYQDDYLTIDLEHHQVRVRQQAVKLTPTEYKLLSYLLQNAGHVLTYQQIIEQVWGWDGQEDVNNVHVYVSHVRRKLEENPKEPKYLLTEHGIGYRFERQIN